MKSLATSVFAFALAATPALSLVTVCPELVLGGFLDPFAATAPALNGTYLLASGGVGVLVAGQVRGAFTYGSDNPLGLWGAGPTANGCPGYAYLNAVSRTAAYSVLTWNATSTANWEAATGGYLTKLGAPPSSDFLACKKLNSTTTYDLFLVTASPLPVSLETAEGDIISSADCVSTKILVTHAPGV